MIDAEALRKIALFGTIPESAVFCSYNAESVYQVPLILDKQGMGDFICQRLAIKCETKISANGSNTLTAGKPRKRSKNSVSRQICWIN